LAKAGDLRRFWYHQKFPKFCGRNLATVQSGLFRIRKQWRRNGWIRLESFRRLT